MPRLSHPQLELANKQSELQRITADVALLRRRSAAELQRLRTTLAATGLVSLPPAPNGLGQQPEQMPQLWQDEPQGPSSGRLPTAQQQQRRLPWRIACQEAVLRRGLDAAACLHRHSALQQRQHGVAHTVIADNAAGILLANGQVVHGVTTTAFAFTSLLTIPVFNQMWVYGVSIAASFIVSFLMVAMFDYRTPEQKAEVLARAAANQKTAVSSVEAKGVAPAAATATATVAATKTEAPAAAAATTTVVNAPVAGHVISLDETGDPVFASRALGEGVGIQPADSTVVAPVSGVLQTVAETGHAFGIKTDDGVEVLVHVGIDTVKMNGEGFDVKVKANEHVNAGDNLVVVDFDKVKEAGYSTTTLMTVLNTVAFASVTPKNGVDVKAGESVIDIQH